MHSIAGSMKYNIGTDSSSTLVGLHTVPRISRAPSGGRVHEEMEALKRRSELAFLVVNWSLRKYCYSDPYVVGSPAPHVS